MVSKIDPSTGKPYFDEIMRAWPVRTQTERERDGEDGRFFYGYYVDPWEEWVANYKRTDPKTKFALWKQLTMPQRAQVKRIYKLQEPENPNLGKRIVYGIIAVAGLILLAWCSAL